MDHTVKNKDPLVSERLFHTALDHFPGVFVIYDEERRIRYVNAYAVRSTGISKERFYG